MAARKNKETEETTESKVVFKVSNKSKKLLSIGPNIAIPPRGEGLVEVKDARGQDRIRRLFDRGLANVELVSGTAFNTPTKPEKKEKRKPKERSEDLSKVGGEGFVDPVTVSDTPPTGEGGEGGGDDPLI